MIEGIPAQVELLLTYYFTYIGFTLEILIGEIIFSGHYEKRIGFCRRIAGAFLMGIAAAVLIGTLKMFRNSIGISEHVFGETFRYVILILVVAGGMYLSFEVNRKQLLVLAVTGYAIQHMISQAELIYYSFSISRVTWMILTRALTIFYFYLIYRFLAKKEDSSMVMRLEDKNVLMLSVITIFMVLVLSSARDYYQDESVALNVISRIFSVMCCVFILMLRSGFLERGQLNYEMDTLKQLRHKERAQFEQSRENIELINIKCHDLKKRLQQYEDSKVGLTPEEIAEIKESIDIYDSTIKTGNEILDAILTERSLVCEKKNIKFSCIADGEALDFMSAGDVFALFANAVDNAIEAVSKLSDEEKIISLTVRRRMGMVSVMVDNYYDREALTFDNGLPKTTKSNAAYHGFGMKSIRMTVEKYGGQMNIKTDDMFHLSILLPETSD